MKFRLSKFHLLCFVSKTFSRSLCVSSGEIDMDRKMEMTSKKDCFSGLLVHKCIDKKTIARDEM